jgi:hypothetical protein
VTVLLDTGPLYAAADDTDRHHGSCTALIRELATAREPMLVPHPVLIETCWLLGRFVGPAAEADFLDLAAQGQWELVAPTAADLTRAAELVRTYADFPLGAVDASVIAIAERLEISRIATVDRRHFAVVRPRHIEAFVLLP